MDKRIVEFLIKAKKASYAGKGSETSSSRKKSHDLTYQEGNLMYYDTYLGSKRFAGEEALWIDNKPYWSMNYIGRSLSDDFDINFLREALLLVPENKPFRGPDKHINGNYMYQCDVDGGFEWFQGIERIYYNNSLVYECVFHGGLVD